MTVTIARLIFAAILLGAACAVAWYAVPREAAAGNVVAVTTIQDNENVDGLCSLREAIKALDENAVVDACNGTGGNDTIQLPPSVIRVFDPLRPKSSMTIQGTPGQSGIDGQSFDRVFIISDSNLNFSVTLKDFQIQNGRTVAGGAGINNGEELTLINVTMVNNEALASGGAIANTPSGNLTIRDSVIAGNVSRSGTGGGGIYNSGTLTVFDSAIRDNGDGAQGANGGGISNTGTMTLERVLVADNTSDTVVDPVDDGNGGGIYNKGTANIRNSTISGNIAATGGAIFNDEGGTVNLVQSTIANNAGQPGAGSPTHFDGIVNLGIVNSQNTIHANVSAAENCSAPITSQGRNIDSGNSCGLNAAGDRANTNPQIAPLADNGGPTHTHALLEGSPAIDAGGATCAILNDQRGEPRPQANGCDIGAFESAFVGPTPAPTPEPTPVPTPGPTPQGDIDCDNDVDTVDGLKINRHVAALPVQQGEGCPPVGGAAMFGDVDCDNDVDTVDALKVLRHVAGLSVAQNEPCPDIGVPLS